MSFKFQHLDKKNGLRKNAKDKKIPDSNKLRAEEVVMTGAMLLILFGPQKLRPWLRNFITFIGVGGTVVNLCRGRF